MRMILKIIWESISQAFQQLRANKLRSFLSLLGISIGIFSIIGVLSGVDSLENNVRSSLQKLGNNVVYVKKWPWADSSGDWWKIIKRPQPDHSDYEVINKKVNSAQLTAYYVVVGIKTVKFKAAAVENSYLIGCSQEVAEIFNIEFDKGRYFSPAEYFSGSPKMVLGYQVADELFGAIDPLGKEVKMMGRKYEVIGVITKAGDELLNPLDFDDCILVSYYNARNLANLKSRQIFDGTVTIKAAEGVEIRQLKDEVKGVLRSHHRLKPKQNDDFALNELSMITQVFDNIFGVMNILGWVIGIFAMIVGGVSVANIMFVSVKERTNIIGIKKALGAKQFVILLEFLIESIILCLIGGVIGLGIVQVATMIFSKVLNFDLYLNAGNIMIGVFVSVVVGVVSGFIPAIQGARMDPVEAMRKK